VDQSHQSYLVKYNHLKALQIVCCVVSESFYARGQDGKNSHLSQKRIYFFLQEIREMDEQEMDEQEVEKLEQ